MNKLLDIIPESETDLRQVIEESDNKKETLLAFIGWPTDQWHWDALSEITGKPYEVLQSEMEPHD